jgi:steroid delta-isomerase-like uncharacterized protein
LAAWDQHDTAAFAGLLADDFSFSDVMAPEPFRSREQVQAYMEGWFTAFPDMHIRSTGRVVSEDQVAGEVEFTGTNTGPLRMGSQEVPATGKSVIGTGTYFASVKDGKYVAFRAHPDVASMMAQLGLMPGA